jgi:hypothetical protein
MINRRSRGLRENSSTGRARTAGNQASDGRARRASKVGDSPIGAESYILRAGGPEPFREGEPSAYAGSDGASPSQDRRASSNREKYILRARPNGRMAHGWKSMNGLISVAVVQRPGKTPSGRFCELNHLQGLSPKGPLEFDSARRGPCGKNDGSATSLYPVSTSADQLHNRNFEICDNSIQTKMFRWPTE